MKKNNFMITGAAALVALAAVAGVAFMSYAASEDSSAADTEALSGRMMMGKFGNLSEEDRAEMEAKRTEFQAEREAERSKRQAAIASGNYEAWLETVPAEAPIREKVNTGNFDRFREAHSLMEGGRVILEEELGIERGDMGQSGFGHGQGKMKGKGRMGGCPMAEDATADPAE